MAAAAAPRGGFATAVRAFVVVGVLLALCGLVRPLGDLVARIPTAQALAMLAGVLLVLCAKPFVALVRHPAAIAPVILVWLALVALRSRWAVPGALAAALVVIGVTGSFARVAPGAAVPVFELVLPVSASGIAIAGIGAAFWGLVAGGLYLLATAGLRNRSAD